MPSNLLAGVAQHEREIAAIRRLLLQGSKMLVKIEAAQQRSEQRADRLEKRMDRLEALVDRFIRPLERGGGNGRGKTQIH